MHNVAILALHANLVITLPERPSLKLSLINEMVPGDVSVRNVGIGFPVVR